MEGIPSNAPQLLANRHTYYFSPMDMIGFTLLGSICFALGMGLSPQAITVVILALNFLSIFQHVNIKTGKWIGYFIQRPEQHSVHRRLGVHKYNYSDFPIYDLILAPSETLKTFKAKTAYMREPPPLRYLIWCHLKT